MLCLHHCYALGNFVNCINIAKYYNMSKVLACPLQHYEATLEILTHGGSLLKVPTQSSILLRLFVS